MTQRYLRIVTLLCLAMLCAHGCRDKHGRHFKEWYWRHGTKTRGQLTLIWFEASDTPYTSVWSAILIIGVPEGAKPDDAKAKWDCRRDGKYEFSYKLLNGAVLTSRENEKIVRFFGREEPLEARPLTAKDISTLREVVSLHGVLDERTVGELMKGFETVLPEELSKILAPASATQPSRE